MKIHTVGHSTRAQEDLNALLKQAGVELLIDVRSWPRSRRNPQFDAKVLANALGRVHLTFRPAQLLPTVSCQGDRLNGATGVRHAFMVSC